MVSETKFITVSCDAPDCKRTITFMEKDTQKAIADNPWLLASRKVGTTDNRTFAYCSDECEVAGAASGRHNTQPPKQIVNVPEGQAAEALRQAAMAAEAQRQSDAALKNGTPIVVP